MSKKYYVRLSCVLFSIAVLLIFSLGIVWSDKIVIDDYEFSATPMHGQIDKSHLTVLGFTIGKHSLQDVQSMLGQTETFSVKEHAPSQICYVSKEPDKTIIIFEAGAMGSWKYLTGFRIMSDKTKFPEVSKCKEFNMISRDIKTKSGIKLGISKNKFRTMFGKPIKEIDNNWFYVYHALKKQGKDVYDVSAYVRATFLSSKMEDISITWIKTSH